MTAPIVKLDNPILDYAWGSHQAIAELQGRPYPTERPEAELWIGDHAKAPSTVHDGSETVPLPDWIERDRAGVLGPGADRLPFLVKILAASRSLSVQVHPNAEQARAGFERETKAGIPVARRCYPDPNPKHELLVALSRFEALCGFRDDAEVVPLLEAFPSLSKLSAEGDPRPISVQLFHGLQGLGDEGRRQLAAELRDFCRGGSRESDWVSRLSVEHPGDPLVVAPILLNAVVLEAGQALVVRPGTVHAYLSGTGVEVMTPSDNVVRGGLTPKHVDAGELALVTAAAAGPADIIAPVRTGALATYPSGSPAFAVRVHDLAAEQVADGSTGAVSVVLCVEGSVGVAGVGASEVSLRAGEAALVPAGIEGYRLKGSEGTNRVFEVSSG